ncbi:MAG: hypothetical protein AUJ96_23280 [Armatimonadetes bacterium CG2_30_66_41]|nr:hypothetical protein [Armatimonadota bacterium]OIO97374.1 MAG: hypothetical protein AUJ96_23280 [Armatimonadetes bacterium CG2_30_66_41]PIU92617.1 MAG: hypothetical protein COS65_16865 [Armatimonadetes bacterium CG06_land_8_20_14_3_00_66_21]PIW13182.1 MAG: hypothetical protein COW34_11005 [Armatimonadetes bacterium CG17_big_fil_post_rev_8_21_14_2_50_66_6]PIX46486.1 MAG: hypothetical protein COZ57_11905 [Armatimonadetes bacterium CG_4_8_14_3_um_filter_66_20]
MIGHNKSGSTFGAAGRGVVGVSALLFAMFVTAAIGEEGGPYPTGIPSYAKAAVALLPAAASSGKEPAATQYRAVEANVEGSFLVYPADAPGDYLTQEIDVPEEGAYELNVWMPKGPKCGTFVVLLDGERVGPEHDGYAVEAQGPMPVELGVTALTAGAHRLQFLVTGRSKESRGHELWIDSYVVRPKPTGRFVTLWEVAGPFGGDAMAATAPPEAAFWRQVAADRGRLDFVRWMGEAENAAAWARAVVKSPTDQDTTLWVGSDDGVAVWLNGEKVHEYLNARPALPDQDLVKVHLKEGDNQLLIRVNNISMGWELLVRPQDPKGELGIPGGEPEAKPAAEGFPAVQPDGKVTPPAPGEGEKKPEGERKPLDGQE